MFEGDPDPKAARNEFAASNFGTLAPAARAVDVVEVDLPDFRAEFLVKGDDVIYHLFRKTQTAWPHDFRSKLWNAMHEAFRLGGREEKLLIEWVPEFFSWCVTIKDIASIVPPPKSRVVGALEMI